MPGLANFLKLFCGADDLRSSHDNSHFFNVIGLEWGGDWFLLLVSDYPTSEWFFFVRRVKLSPVCW